MPSDPDLDWTAYLSDFHADRPGITEDVLQHTFDRQRRTPYDWLADASAGGRQVLDLACGSGPMHARLPHATSYVGLDLAAGELAVAAGHGLPVAQADASGLPLRDSTVDLVVMSMALMLVPLASTLREVRRVLTQGGVLVATVPANRPLPRADRLRYARLCLALRHLGLTYPNDLTLANPGPHFLAADLRLTADDSRAFGYELRDEQSADRFLDSLYLPDVGARHLDRGRRVVRRWSGTTIAVPIRRLVARAA